MSLTEVRAEKRETGDEEEKRESERAKSRRLRGVGGVECGDSTWGITRSLLH